MNRIYEELTSIAEEYPVAKSLLDLFETNSSALYTFDTAVNLIIARDQSKSAIGYSVHDSAIIDAMAYALDDGILELCACVNRAYYQKHGYWFTFTEDLAKMCARKRR